MYSYAIDSEMEQLSGGRTSQSIQTRGAVERVRDMLCALAVFFRETKKISISHYLREGN